MPHITIDGGSSKEIVDSGFQQGGTDTNRLANDVVDASSPGATDRLTDVGATPDPPIKIVYYRNSPQPDPSMPDAVDALLSSNQWIAEPTLPTGQIESIDFSSVFTQASAGTPNCDDGALFVPSEIDDFSSEAPLRIAYGGAYCFSSPTSRRTRQ